MYSVITSTTPGHHLKPVHAAYCRLASTRHRASQHTQPAPSAYRRACT